MFAQGCDLGRGGSDSYTSRTRATVASTLKGHVKPAPRGAQRRKTVQGEETAQATRRSRGLEGPAVGLEVAQVQCEADGVAEAKRGKTVRGPFGHDRV